MNNREKIISAIEKAKKQSEEYAQDAIIVPFKEADMILALLKEQDDVIPIKVVAYFLADYAFPPTDMNKIVFHESKAEVEWEQFLLDLKGRKTGNDKSRSHLDFE